jgi:PAS domain S-box-containing protein
MMPTVISLRNAVGAVLLAATYFAAAKLSLPLAIPPGYATAVWPPSGIALAALLLLGTRLWPGIWLGAAIVNLAVESSWAAAALIATGNSLEAVIAATLIRQRMGAPLRFARGTDVFVLVAACAVGAVIAASIGTLALSLGNPVSASEVAYNWWTWWQGDVCGMVIVAPLILTWRGRATIAWTGPRMLEAAGFAALLLLATQFLFGRPAASGLPVAVPFVILPLFVWAAFRFGQREVSTAIAAVCALSVFHTVSGRGPFAAGTLNQSLLALLLFVGVAIFLGLVMSAVLQERERALAELANRHDELKERFQLMVDSVVDYAIYMLDAQGRVASWNAGAQMIKGYRAEEIIGKDYAAFFPPEDAAAGKPQSMLAVAESQGRASDQGWRKRKDGSMFWADVALTAVRDARGRLIGYGKVTRDLTERRRAEAELLAAKAAAEKASSAKSEFLAKMSHELRTPLNSLLILAKLLSDNSAGNLDARQVRYARTIHDAGSDLLALINDVLDLAKIEAGAPLPMHIQPLRFDELRDALEGAFRQVAQGKDLQFSMQLDPSLPEAFMTDGQRLRQILNNLLSNALKFTPQGGVTLRIFRSGADRVTFEVADTGIGIPPDQRESVFEAFRQVDGGTARRFGGTGLGLSISRELARLLNGQIRVAGAEGGGTVFTLILPLATAEVDENAAVTR